MILTIRPATREDVVSVASHLRPDDKREVEKATGQPAEQVVPFAFDSMPDRSDCYSIRLQRGFNTIDEDPTVIFGCQPDTMHEGMGIIWMLSTSEIVRAPMSMLREARFWIPQFLEKYPNGLHNSVASFNGLHLRWLRLLGFREMNTYEVRGEKFIYVLNTNTNNV